MCLKFAPGAYVRTVRKMHMYRTQHSKPKQGFESGRQLTLEGLQAAESCPRQPVHPSHLAAAPHRTGSAELALQTPPCIPNQVFLLRQALQAVACAAVAHTRLECLWQQDVLQRHMFISGTENSDDLAATATMSSLLPVRMLARCDCLFGWTLLLCNATHEH